MTLEIQGKVNHNSNRLEHLYDTHCACGNLVEIRVTVFELSRYIKALRTDGRTDAADNNTPSAEVAEG